MADILKSQCIVTICFILITYFLCPGSLIFTMNKTRFFVIDRCFLDCQTLTSDLPIGSDWVLCDDGHDWVNRRFGWQDVMDKVVHSTSADVATLPVALDNKVPRVFSFTPPDAATGVAIGSNLVLIFNEDVRRGSGNISIHSGSVTGTLVASYDVATSSEITVSGNMLTINPAYDLLHSTQYFVTLDPGSVKDFSGNNYSGSTDYDFTTTSAVPMVAGSLESWEYLASWSDLINWLSTDTATAAWHYNTYAEAENRFIRFDAWDYLASNVDLMNWLGTNVEKASEHYILYGINENRSFSFDAAAYLAANIDLFNWLGNDYDAATKHYIEYGRFEIQQGFRSPLPSPVDTTAPTILSLNPLDGSTGAALDSNIVLTFSEAIEKGSGVIEIHSGSATGPLVVSYNAATSQNLVILGKTLTIDPTSDLLNNTHYFVTLAPGSIKDLADNNYSGTSSYDFTTIPDTIPPTVLSFYPADSATDVLVDSNIVLTFSELIQRGTGDIVIHRDLVTGNVVESFNAATSPFLHFTENTLTIDPTSDLSNSSHFFITLDPGSIKDLAGNSYEGTSTYDFTTVADTTPPQVIRFTPHDAAVDVSISSNIVVTFSETIQRGIGTIEIHRDSPTGSVVESYNVATSGNISLSENILTINPDADLANGTHYYLTISEGSITDLVGNGYHGTSSYDFTTVVSVSSAFNISLDYFGNEAYRTYFQKAITRWEEVITGDLPAFAGVDDISISASVIYIDGASGTLAQAAPTEFRTTSNHLPYEGFMQFYSADVAWMAENGILTSVITHEIAHVLGFGSSYLWDYDGFYAGPGRYTGANALNEYRSISGNSSAAYVPLETGGGPGTADAHWSESVFGRELMTGWSSSTLPMPLSRMTIAAMQDLGYTVNYSAADSFSLISAVSSNLQAEIAGLVDTTDGSIYTLFFV